MYLKSDRGRSKICNYRDFITLFRQEQIRTLHEKLSQNKHDRLEVERKLKLENDEKLAQSIALQNEIQQLEKANEKDNNEIVSKYEVQIRDIKKKGDEKMQDNEVKINELQENRNIMDETYKRRIQYEAELHHWKTQCASISKQI